MKCLLLLVLLAGCGKHTGELQYVDVKRDDLTIGAEISGELEAIDSTDIHPPNVGEIWNFKIAQIASEGDDVKAGEPLVAFDPSEVMRSLETMQNEADAAQKKLEQKRDDAALARRDDELKVAEAESTLKKAGLKAAGSPDLVAAVDLETEKLDEQNAKLVLAGAKFHAESTKKSDEQEIAQLAEKATYAKHRAEVLRASIPQMQVTSPRDGTIVTPADWQGNKKKVGDPAWKGETVLQVVGLGKMQGKGIVDEVDLSRVRTTQLVTLRLDALPDVKLTGHIDQIEKSVGAKSSTDPSRVAKLVIALDKTAVPLRPGMRFRGEVETDKLVQVVQVPVEAVFVTAAGPVAYRKQGSGFEKVKLVLGKRSASAIEVKSGLAPGDRVSRVDPGAKP
ncbi:MAG TPA: HlyD family efflux transporter periplasmic adaptor subunit [Kofleriaceae bacterium]|nr:HlyD family efflux transporter periplasmic adaptor subunit [Kofleriaceae bacterium]